MIWRTLHWIFGWDYVMWQNIADHGVARVRVNPEGRIFYWRYRNIGVLDEIKDRNQVFWLTCKSDKYFKT